MPLRDVALGETPISLAGELPTLPPISWLEVTASAKDSRFVEYVRPALTYPGSEIRLALDHGRPAIGLYRVVDRDLPAAVARIAAQPVGPLTGVVSVDIVTRSYPQGGLTVEVAGAPRALDPAALPEADKRGWPIASVLAAVVPDAHPRRLRVVGEDTEQVIELDRDITLKLTHQGAYVLRVWENGRAIVDVRPLTKLVVE